MGRKGVVALVHMRELEKMMPERILQLKKCWPNRVQGILKAFSSERDN
jgi:hypothetical protein